MMHFIRHKERRLYAVKDKAKVGCTFQVEKFRSDGTITYRGPVFSNLVLNGGLDALADTGLSFGSLGYINVGEGSTSPAQTQTGLDSFLAATNSKSDYLSGYQASTPYHKWTRCTFEFSIGSCTGNLTEVGVSKSSNSTYFNRQLFKDGQGDPTTITVLSDEGLRITATFYFYPDLEPGDTETGSFLLNGSTTINFTREIESSNLLWLTQFGSYYYNPAFKPFSGYNSSIEITDSPTGFSGTSPDTYTPQTYTAGNYYRDAEAVWAPGDFVGDVNSILLQLPVDDSGLYDFTAFRLDTPISLTENDQLTLVLRRGWGRYAA